MQPRPERRMAAQRRRGAALLEVLVAITLLVVAGALAVRMAVASARTVAAVRDTESRLRRASAFLEVVALWTRDDLDRRLGERPQGPWQLHVQRTSPTLYVVILVDSGDGRELLRTSLHRPLAWEQAYSVAPGTPMPTGQPSGPPDAP